MNNARRNDRPRSLSSLPRFSELSLRTYLAVWVFVLVVLPAGTIIALAYHHERNQIVAASMRAVGRVAEGRHELLKYRLERAVSRAQRAVQDMVERCGSLAAHADCYRARLDVLQGAEGALGVALWAPSAQAQQAIRSGDIALDALPNTPFKPGQLAQFALHQPGVARRYWVVVPDASGRYRLGLSFPVGNIQPVFTPPPSELGRSGETFLADSAGYFISSARYGSVQGHGSDPISATPMQRCLSPENVEVLDLDYRDVPIIHGFRFVPEIGGGCIMSHIDQAEAFAPLQQLRQTMLLTVAGLLALALLAAYGVARWIALPVQRVTRAIGRFTLDGPGALHEPVYAPYREVHELSAAFARLTQQLQQSQRDTDALLGTLNLYAIISVADRSGRITAVNDAFCKISGYGRDELIGQKHSIIKSDVQPAEFWQAMWKTIAAGTPWHAPVCNRAKDGTLYWVDSFIAPFLGADGKIEKYISIRFDISDSKRNELALTEAMAQAQAASQSKSQFLANMSHEIRTPMNAILGMLSLLQDTELTARQRDYASKTDGAAKSLLGLLNDILDFSKVEAGKMALEAAPFRIDTMLRNLSVVLSASLGSKDIEVLFDVDPELPEVVLGDAMRLQQVLINLGGNAVKFTAQGQVVLCLRQRSASPAAVRIEFSVQDTGIGIAPEHQAHLFNSFTQAEGSTTRRFGGTGLGLAISKRLIALMGGDIQLCSTPGEGTTVTFVLELPRVPEVPPELGAPARVAVQPQQVLVVDDNPVAAELCVRMVRSWGWRAESADSGAQALALVEARLAQSGAEFPFSLVFMDWQMPRMDGWETTRRLRALAQQASLPQPTIIMVTAHGRDRLALRSQAEQDLLDGFLVKPMTASMLLDAYMEAAAGRSGVRKLAQGRSSGRQLAGMRILVVEDNLINQQVAEELLSGEGAIVSLAANGRLGVDAVAAAAPQFDVVLMDIQMPVLDGYGATKLIRQELGLAHLPIIAMTANAMASDRAACLDAGMDEHIGKPFDIARLVSLLIRLTGLIPCTQVQPSDFAPTVPLSELPVVPGLELSQALARMSGMRALYVRTARDFARLLSTFIQELRPVLQAGDCKGAQMRLHTLKGNAATLGANDLARQAAALEQLCKEGDALAPCLAALDGLDVLVLATKNRLAQAIGQLDAEVVVQAHEAVDSAQLGAQLQAVRDIQALAIASNLDALQCFAQVRTLLAGLPGGFADQLDAALQNLDLETAAGLCRTLLAQHAG